MTSPISSSTTTNPWQYPDPTTQNASASSSSSSGTQRTGGHHHHHHGGGSVDGATSTDSTSSTDPTQDPFLQALDSESTDPDATTAAPQSGQTLDTFL